MPRPLLGRTVLAALVSLLLASPAFAGFSAIQWKEPGSSSLQDSTISSCGKPETVDIRVSYALNETFVIGGHDPACPGGYLANPYRFTVDLFRDGAQIGHQRFNTSGCYFRTYFQGIEAQPGSYRARIRFDRRRFPGYWQEVETHHTKVLGAVMQTAVPKFEVNGQAIPDDGSPIAVSGAHPIRIDGSSTVCAPNYFVGVEESDRWWNRTHLYEWGRWFPGGPGNDLNLQKLATTYSGPQDYLGTDPNRQGAALTGGHLPPPQNSKERHYRVKLCTAEPSWDCAIALIRVE